MDVFLHGVSTLPCSIDASVTDLFQGGPIGCLFDAYGPTGLLSSGSLILVLSLILTSISAQYYHYLLSQGVLFGLGVALLYVLSTLAPKCQFNHDLAFILVWPAWRHTSTSIVPLLQASCQLDLVAVCILRLTANHYLTGFRGSRLSNHAPLPLQ